MYTAYSVNVNITVRRFGNLDFYTRESNPRRNAITTIFIEEKLICESPVKLNHCRRKLQDRKTIFLCASCCVFSEERPGLDPQVREGVYQSTPKRGRYHPCLPLNNVRVFRGNSPQGFPSYSLIEP